MPYVGIGGLDRPLQLQRRQSDEDSEGRPQELWATLARAWGQVQPLSASEHMLAAQAGLTVSHQIVVRWRPELGYPPQAGGTQAGHNLRLLDPVGPYQRVYEIHSVLPVDDNRRFIRLLCSELQEV